MSKAKRHLRACPAVGREITSQECGENRASKYACPAACPYNPWSPANYDLTLDLNQRLTGKLMERIRRERHDDDAWLRRAAEVIEDTPDRVTAFWRWQFFGERDAAGRTFFERWAAEDFRGLTNDERVMLRLHTGTRTAVLEVQRIIDEDALEAVDLLGERSPDFRQRLAGPTEALARKLPPAAYRPGGVRFDFRRNGRSEEHRLPSRAHPADDSLPESCRGRTRLPRRGLTARRRQAGFWMRLSPG